MRRYERWFAGGAIYGMVVGVALIAVALAPDQLGFESIFRSLFWPRVERFGTITDFARAGVAVSGGLTAGWGLMLWLLRSLLRGPSARTVGDAIVGGFVFWFLLDSAACVALGASWNLVGNVSFFLAVVPPAFVLSRERPPSGA